MYQFVDFMNFVKPADSDACQMRVQPEPLTWREQRWECYHQVLRHWEREGGWWRFVSNVDSSIIADRLNALDKTTVQTEVSSEAEGQDCEKYLNDSGCYRSAASQQENEACSNEAFYGMTFHGMTAVICDLMTDDEFCEREATSPERRSAIMTKLVKLRVQQITEQDVPPERKGEQAREGGPRCADAPQS